MDVDPWHVSRAQSTYDALCDFADGVPGSMSPGQARALVAITRPQPTHARPEHAHNPAWCMLGRCPDWDTLRTRVLARCGDIVRD
jgi:hypothetical protein